MRMRLVLPLLILASLLSPEFLPAQEVDCSIQVNLEAVPTTHRDRLVNLAEDLRAYVSHYNWGGGETGEKVKCTMSIFVKGVQGENSYVAQVFIGSVRPRYQSEGNSAVVRLLDDSWEFSYFKDRPISHNPYSFNDLASFLDFYMYLVMGYDYDTYDRLGGTPLFQKAADIVRLGRSSGGKAWLPAQGTYTRAQLVEELLSPQFEGLRAAAWEYHFNGLDSLAIAPERGYVHMLSALESIAKVRQSVDPRNLVIRTWFDAKYLEIAQLFAKHPDPDIYRKLARIDPANQKTYDQYGAERK